MADSDRRVESDKKAESDGSGLHFSLSDFLAPTFSMCEHYLWREELGYLLSPFIPYQGSRDAIADVATDSGVWLLDVAKKYPYAQCFGLDISTKLCPPNAWLPANVAFQSWDIHHNPPVFLRVRFDVVHVRSLCGVIRADPDSVVRNMAALLKPHGYLQWEEVETSCAYIETVNATVRAHAVLDMGRLVRASPECVLMPNIPDLLRANGFYNVQWSRVVPPKPLLKYHTDMLVLKWAELVSRLPATDERKEQYSRLMLDVKEETQKGVACVSPKMVFVAQRTW
ncbi:MAG: hypothetical protein Q9185_004993 [Variospora sp. 1 TL-2023]